ncbi:MAG: ABC transporter ATP-binding protein [Caldisericia bacterium]|jgi:iron complex transport system ATP-binding protein|nr:ABC transporter ATP-binding protein [Caldisericia bacterium]
MNNKKIIIKNLNFGYYDSEIFKEFSFEIESGEILTILGPNGSGKTTLLKLIQKILSPKGGNIIVSGKDINEYTFKELSKEISYVPQIHTPKFPFTVFDFVLMGRNPYIDNYSLPTEKDMEIVENSLKDLGILYLKDRPYIDISGGELRLVLIARAIAQETDVLLLDEPTAFLDFKNKLFVLKKIKELKQKRNLTVVITLHDPNEAINFSDRILLINKNEIVSFGPPEIVLSKENIKKVYSVEIEIFQINDRKFIVPKEKI